MILRRTAAQVRAAVRGRGLERSVASALTVFRIVSWALTSLVYVTSPDQQGATAFKIGVAGLLLVAAVLSSLLLDRSEGDIRQMAGIAIAEAVAIPAVLLPTGGIASPFVWYALNPLLVAAVHLPIGYTWGVMGVFLATALAATAVSPLTSDLPLTAHSQVVLILMLVTLTTRVQAGLLRTVESQAVRIGDQSQALKEAYDALAARGEASAAVVEFQRQGLALESHAALYRMLTSGIRSRFGTAWAAVLHTDADSQGEPFDCAWLSGNPICSLSESGARAGLDWAGAWTAAQEAAGGSNRDLLDYGGEFMIAPLLVEDGNLVALFALHGLEPARRTELAVWLESARQLAARIAASERMRHTLDYVGDVYQLVEGAGASHQESDLLELITLYAKQLTAATKAAYWPADQDAPESLRPIPSIIRGRREGILAESFGAQVADWWASADSAPASLGRYDDSATLWHTCYTVVRSSDRRFGVLFVLSDRPFGVGFDVVRTMGFLGYLAGAMLERQRAEDLHGRLLVAEEQGRIAAEIHDGVSQSLFSLVYGIQGAMGSLEAGKSDEVKHTLETLRNVAANVSREIRTSIYQLTQSEGKGTFVRAVRGHLEDLGELYGISADLAVAGSEDNLSPAMRRTVYRIVREAASNAARHGHGTRVAVRLTLNPQQTIIEIQDDGVGFEPAKPVAAVQKPAAGNRGGLGLLNMRQLARSFSGAVEVDSAPGRGTTVTVRMPERVAGEGVTHEAASGR